MSTGKLAYAEACEIARHWLEWLTPYCHRIEVAGSLRRLRPFVGDIEIVAVPTVELDLVGQPLSRQIDAYLDARVKDGTLEIVQGHKPGARNARYRIVCERSAPVLDLYLVTATTWGVQFAIRTGPADFSKAIVTERYRGGRLLDGYQVKGGQLWRLGVHGPDEIVDTPEEADFLEYAGGMIDPTARSVTSAWNPPKPREPDVHEPSE